MGMVARRLSCILLGAMLAASCSVKENRSGCPCVVDIMFDGYCHEPLSARFVSPGEYESVAAFDNVMFDGAEGHLAIHDGEIPRRQLVLAACSGVVTSNFDGRVISIPRGFEMDSVSSAQKFLDARLESLSATLTLMKQFCRLRIISVDPAFEFRVRIHGNVSGYDILDETPVQGVFLYDAGLLPTTVNVPRQLDGSLTMELLGKDSEVLESLPLGQYIAATGYDWKAASLPDCTILIDYARATVSVVVNDWEEGGNFVQHY